MDLDLMIETLEQEEKNIRQAIVMLKKLRVIRGGAANVAAKATSAVTPKKKRVSIPQKQIVTNATTPATV